MDEITIEQIQELIVKSRTGLITIEKMRKFLENPDSERYTGLSEFQVTVDYGMTLEQMIDSGQYGSKDECISSKNFPITGEGVLEIKLELVCFHVIKSMSEVETCLKESGLRAATLEELLAFGATYPEIQRKFPIIGLGAFWVDSDKYRRTPHLGMVGSKRRLGIDRSEYGWSDYCRFLVARK